MKLVKIAGATSEKWQIFIRDSSSVVGAGLTGLTYQSGSLTAYYHRDTDTTATAISLADMTVGTFTSSGFKVIDGTNMPGCYQFCPPNAALATGAKTCLFMLKGAANMAQLVIEVQLDSEAALLDAASAVETGLTVRQALRGISSTGFGKNSGMGGSSPIFRNAAADDADRITVTMTGKDRTAITLNL